MIEARHRAHPLSLPWRYLENTIAKLDLAPARPIRVDSFRQGAWPKFDIIGVFLH